jgi:molybdate transport system ATP-binding protein
MLLVSHSISEVAALAESALVMAAGRITASGRPFKVMLEKSVGFGHEDGGLENILDGEVAEAGDGGAGRVRVGTATLYAPVGDLPPGAKVSVSIGANEVIVASAKPSGLSARNIVPGRVAEMEAGGGMAVAAVDIGVRLIVELTEGSVRELGLKTGSEVFLVFKSTSVAVRPLTSGASSGQTG